MQAANQLTKLDGLDQLQHLATLHLRDNQLEKLDGFSENMKNLQYINLRYRKPVCTGTEEALIIGK